MIDNERIANMVKDIERYFSDLEEIKIGNKNELQEPEKKHSVSMLVFSIVNRVLDISNEFIAGSKIPSPASYRDAFDLLKTHKIISPQTAEKMIWLVKYRNIIAHEYYVFGVDEIFQLKKRIYDVELFIQEIKRHIR